MKRVSPRINFRELDNGSWKYEFDIEDHTMMISQRTFLTYQECRLESEWVLNKLGYEFQKDEVDA